MRREPTTGWHPGGPGIIPTHSTGLWIELKAPKGPGLEPGRLEPGQLDWLDALNAHGYKAVARWGWEAARETLIDYLEGKP
ncbi:hypothetical protein [Methylomagnum ishizawai]|uniref:hypothetical protein n=1 Tax=Methylomagnum ishizawai TaxID=1760988 RepID=UPI001C806985|nr:hypothetical protein [Methylomagnum ishizawai]